MKFKDLAAYLDKLEKTPSRNEITIILSELFKVAEKKEIDKIVYLVLGSLAPNYQGVVLNLAEKMMVRAIAKAYNKDDDSVMKLYKEKGDIGNVAQALSKNIDSKFEVSEIFNELLIIANESGEKSQDKKLDLMAELLNGLDSLSARFIARIPIGRLRLGFSEKTIIDALSLMDRGDKSASVEIESAYNVMSDIGKLAQVVKEKGTRGLSKNIKPEVGIPIAPMLAARLKSTSEMIKKMGTVSVEPKYDGLRIFIHYKKKPEFIRIYTRNMNFIDNSVFPELSSVGKYIKADEVILDTEAVGVDEKREEILDFQKTIQRRRKHNIGQASKDIPLQFQVFDILLKDGKSLINTPYIERREVLDKTVVNGSLLKVDEHTVTDDPEVIKKLHEKYTKVGLEGVIVKKINGFYVSGRTGWNWVKMKEKEESDGRLSDTIDCVIMGFTVGKGKRVGFGVGQFLAGVVDGEEIKSITKVGTGLTDEQFKNLSLRLRKIISKEKPKEYNVHKDLYPDYWVLPKVIVELAADEITKSPKHTAGLALRFPRLIKFRDDKNMGQATTIKELQDLLKINWQRIVKGRT
ncbi:MAG: ATP-dependent DNA ligase [Patescibacteria group bacterium]